MKGSYYSGSYSHQRFNVVKRREEGGGVKVLFSTKNFLQHDIYFHKVESENLLKVI